MWKSHSHLGYCLKLHVDLRLSLRIIQDENVPLDL